MERTIDVSAKVHAAFERVRNVLIDDPAAVLAERCTQEHRRSRQFHAELAVELSAGCGAAGRPCRAAAADPGRWLRPTPARIPLDVQLQQTSTRWRDAPTSASSARSIQEVLDITAERWGVLVQLVELKDIELPESMKRAMAREAEAEREKRGKIIAAEGEALSVGKLAEAADVIVAHPVALQLRNLQVLAEIAIEKNSTIIFPAQFMGTVRALQQFLDSEQPNELSPEPAVSG